MPTEPIPLHMGMVVSPDDFRIDDYLPELRDVFVDKNGYVHKRFGLISFATTVINRIIGIYHWKSQSVVVAVLRRDTNNDVFTITEAGVSTGRGATDETDSASVVTFVDWGSDLYFCVGDDIHTLNSSLTYSELGDADIPATCENITLLDKYLIAAKNASGEFHFSDVGAPTAWSGNYAEAEVEQDYLVRAEAKNQRLYLFGKKTIEIWYDDGATPFVRIPQGIIHVGLKEKLSLTWVDYLQTFVWISDKHEIFMLKGLQAVPVSKELTQRLESMLGTLQANMQLFSAAIEGVPLLFIHYIWAGSNDYTLVYDFQNGLIYDWSEWLGSSYSAFHGSCYTYMDGATKACHLIGDKSGGGIYEIASNHKDDFGNTIRSRIRSVGTDRSHPGAWKRCKALHFRMKRTADVSPSNPTSISLSLRYRDNGSPTWTTARTVTLSATAADGTDFIGKTRRLGRYQTRQWEIVIDDSVPCCLLPVLEDFDYL